MDKDSAVITAAFAFIEREGSDSPIAQKLRALLPANPADVVDTERAALSDKAIGVLMDDPVALAWVQTFIRDREAAKSFGPIDSTIAQQQVYVCPQGDYRWTRPFISYPVPLCPQHHAKLESL